jgi:hypothetical protein
MMALQGRRVDPPTYLDSGELRTVQALRLQTTLGCTESLAFELARLIYGERCVR